MKVLCLLLLCLLQLTQQSCADDPSTIIFQQSTSNYNFVNTNTWTAYPQLQISLQLAESQIVNIGYVITVGSSDQTNLVTRLIVDNVEVQYYRAISGNVIYHTNAVDGYISLSQGTHQIRVEYRTPGTVSYNSATDWNTAQLQVTY